MADIRRRQFGYGSFCRLHFTRTIESHEWKRVPFMYHQAGMESEIPGVARHQAGYGPSLLVGYKKGRREHNIYYFKVK